MEKIKYINIIMLHNIYNSIYKFIKECYKEKTEKKYTLNECLEILNRNFQLQISEIK
jgi:hypothetical protein